MIHLRARKALSIAAMSILLVSCAQEDESAAENTDTSGNASLATGDTLTSTAPSPTAATPAAASAGDAADMIASLADIDADILGVRLGMTPEEAHAKLSEALPDANIPKLYYTTMTSNSRPVPPDTPGAFVGGIGINNPEKVQIRFSRPPAENVVISVERNQSLSGQKNTSLEVFRDSLIEKYGEPDEAPVWNDVLHYFKWLYPSGAADCNPLETGVKATDYRNWPTDVDDLPHPPERCATALIYTLTVRNGIVAFADAKLGNVGVIDLNNEAYAALRKEMREQAAAAAREAATDKPDL